jgi:arginyl-tRNA synthetase
MKNKIDEIIKKFIINKLQIKDEVKYKIDTPKNKKFGDFSANFAMILASKLKRNPVEIAEMAVGEFEKEPVFSKVEIAGKGFINFFINQTYWVDLLNEIYNKSDYFKHDIGKNRKALIEFVSANPTGPLHIGHGRGAVLGDVVANLLSEAGFKVVKEYYINDAGNQMNVLGKSVYFRIKELLGESVEFPEDFYQGEYIIEIAKNLIEKYGKEVVDKDTEFFTQEGIKTILPEIVDDLKNFGVKFDSFFSEKSLFEKGKVADVIESLKKAGYIYEKDNAWWIKVEGDDDRVIIKSDGSYTYLTSDIAYHKDKYDRGFDLLVNIWGADHHGYVARLKSAIKYTGYDPDKLEILLVQMVNLLRGKERVPLSTRKGKFVTLKEVVDEVGKDAARFIFMTRKYDAQLDFDLELAKQQSNENPVYYVQYAHARICSILRNSDITVPGRIEKVTCEDDIEIIKKLEEFRHILKVAANNLEPHLITYYLLELAAKFHSYYNKNKVLGNPERLFLIKTIKKVIKKGLDILGVSAPEKM